MKFRVRTVWKDDFNDIIKTYPVLNKYHVYKENNCMYLDIKTLDLLVGDFMEDINHKIIIQDETGDVMDGIELKGLCIEIYDDWRE